MYAIFTSKFNKQKRICFLGRRLGRSVSYYNCRVRFFRLFWGVKPIERRFFGLGCGGIGGASHLAIGFVWGGEKRKTEFRAGWQLVYGRGITHDTKNSFLCLTPNRVGFFILFDFSSPKNTRSQSIVSIRSHTHTWLEDNLRW